MIDDALQRNGALPGDRLLLCRFDKATNETLDHIVPKMDMALLNGSYFAGVMHAEKRPSDPSSTRAVRPSQTYHMCTSVSVYPVRCELFTVDNVCPLLTFSAGAFGGGAHHNLQLMNLIPLPFTLQRSFLSRVSSSECFIDVLSLPGGKRAVQPFPAGYLRILKDAQ